MNKIGNIILTFAILSSIFTVFRLYFFFFTGHDLSPIPTEDKVLVTIGMMLISGLAYLIGYGLKGKL